MTPAYLARVVVTVRSGVGEFEVLDLGWATEIGLETEPALCIEPIPSIIRRGPSNIRITFFWPPPVTLAIGAIVVARVESGDETLCISRAGVVDNGVRSVAGMPIQGREIVLRAILEPAAS